MSEEVTAADREWLADVRAAESLADLAVRLGVRSGHEAYLTAKPTWFERRGRELAADGRDDCDATARTAADDCDAIPGSCTPIDGVPFAVHGVTHADTDAERSFLRERVQRLLERGATVLCEQGIRRLYFEDTDACAMDDYRWALARCQAVTAESYVSDLLDGRRVEPGEDWIETAGGPSTDHEPDDAAPTVEQLQRRFREAALSLLEGDVNEPEGPLWRALVDVTSAFPASHEDLSTGRDAESVELRRAAATDPTQLAELQRYYERAFLPQRLEREWLARHDAELEIVTHARNARMADYAVAHTTGRTTADAVHLIVGAAHGPGVREYLEAHRDGQRSLEEFELA